MKTAEEEDLSFYYTEVLNFILFISKVTAHPLG